MDLGLVGKRAVVAGASSGLGLACARALAAEGARVVVGGRSEQRLGDAVAASDGALTGVVGDVGTPDGATQWALDAAATLGGVDIVVPNAGGPPPGTFASTDLDAYAPALDLNLLSTVAMCKALVPSMQQRGWGRVVAITSVAVRQPVAELILSNTARAGVTGFLKTLALEVASDGVTVNSVLPGLHDTDRLRALRGGDTAGLGATVPVGEVGRPEDFGAVVAFLCSEHARHITGHALPVDGGAVQGLL
ncbi:SDR family oxidoreductase [Rhabdothermincola salaria]|uniref:SDR family oxidoreductase n=1 Tax=Rhabdothermincola salaria TaxID=2903142 RepID=UPI001E3DAD52|nr:SDR family oxidoreductase [Rhabdothermincola salaria]MCD9625041.1 SDR family oxidoreductase [Rhabdothermincola salaria]